MMAQGRLECPNCGARNTEAISSLSNRRTIKCDGCKNEWKDFTGPECPDCGSQNTRRITIGTAPHRRKVIRCQNCGNNQ